MSRAKKAIGILASVITCLVFAWITRRFDILDLGAWDESLYITRAIQWADLSANWGPIYSLYLTPFTALSTDPIVIFEAARLSLVYVVLPFGLFWFVAKFTGRFGLALLLATLIPTLNTVVLADPGIQLFNFAVWLYLVALAFFIEQNSRGRRSLFLFYGLVAVIALMPYIRQDNTIYLVTFILFLVSWLWRRNPVQDRRLFVAHAFSAVALGALAYTAAAFLLRGSPFVGGRALFAFADHFYWANRPQFPITEGVDRAQLVVRYFGNPSSLSELILGHFSQLVPYFVGRVGKFAHAVYDSLGQGAVAVIAVVLFAIYEIWRDWKSVALAKRIFLGLVVITAAKAASVCILLSPNMNYYVEFLILLLIWCAWELYEKVRRQHGLVRTLAALLVALFLWERSTVLQSLVTLRPPEYRQGAISDRAYIQELRKRVGFVNPEYVGAPLFATGPVADFVVSNRLNRNVFSFQAARTVTPTLTLAAYLDLTRLNIAVINDSFRSVARETGVHVEVERFEKEFEQQGFVRVDEPERATAIYFRRKALL